MDTLLLWGLQLLNFRGLWLFFWAANLDHFHAFMAFNLGLILTGLFLHSLTCLSNTYGLSSLRGFTCHRAAPFLMCLSLYLIFNQALQAATFFPWSQGLHSSSLVWRFYPSNLGIYSPWQGWLHFHLLGADSTSFMGWKFNPTGPHCSIPLVASRNFTNWADFITKVGHTFSPSSWGCFLPFLGSKIGLKP